MNNKKLEQLIKKVLKKDDRLWNEDKTELNETFTQQDGQKLMVF